MMWYGIEARSLAPGRKCTRSTNDWVRHLVASERSMQSDATATAIVSHKLQSAIVTGSTDIAAARRIVFGPKCG